MVNISFDKYKEKVQGCFIGKCVGGTLGMPYEGDTGVREVSFYDPIPDTMLPNDDLDLQVVNLETIMRTGLPICRYYLSEIWKYHIDESTPDEYGVALSNNRTKIFAPLSGQYRNKFTDGMGGAIRSELWACLAPANPGLAAELAREDACTDHSDDGIYAEMFLAAVESAAFIESDLQKLVEIGLAFVPESSRMHNAFSDAICWWKESNDVMTVREKILEKYKVDNWTDVTINLSFILLSLISCGNSFDKAICTAAMLGYDTDCTAATVGSIFGIINPLAIDKKWTDPIGDGLVLSPCIINMHSPDTITEFCENIMSVSFEVQSYYNTDVNITDIPKMFEKKKLPVWTNKYKSVVAWKTGAKESLISVAPVMLNVVYCQCQSKNERKRRRNFVGF